MAKFDKAVLDACATEREVDLTTWGRVSGAPRRVTLWIATDGARLYVRSGGGLGRDWPQNLLRGGRGVLHVAGQDVPVRPRHVTDPAEARGVSALLAQKYGDANITRSRGDEPLTAGESACFELTPQPQPQPEAGDGD